MAFIGLTCVMVASVRMIPDVAATGWTMFFYTLVAALLYGLPIALISAEYACMFPQAGGPELWMTRALGKNWGFLIAWLLWAQMFPGVVTQGSSMAALLGETFGIKALATNRLAILACILCEYWTISLLCIHLDMAKLVGKFGVWLGLYIPALFIFSLGFAALIKLILVPGIISGIQQVSGQQVPEIQQVSGTILGPFKAVELVPSAADSGSLAYFSSILFIFAGIELSSVYIPRLENPRKHYMKSIMAALIFTFLFAAVLGFLVAAVVPKGTLQLNNIAQAVALFCSVLGLPDWVWRLFSGITFFGIAVQGSAWAAGPCKAITESAKRGMYPPSWKFWKANKYNNSKAVILTQATAVSLVSCIYVLMPDLNSAYLLLLNAAALLFNIIYIIMIIGIIVLRIRQADIERPFRIGGKSSGNLPLYLTTGILVLTIVSALIGEFAQCSLSENLVTLGIVLIIVTIPLVIMACRKETWEIALQNPILA
jgi:amino acid transporter